jgi:hypothetical protein
MSLPFFVTDVNEADSVLSETGVEDLDVVLLTSRLEMAARVAIVNQGKETCPRSETL